MAKEKRISVIMCVYKSDNLDAFKLAVESILNQTIECDLLIYQDGLMPSDFSIVLNDYEKLDAVTVFRKEKNKGLAVGLNFLINYSLDHGYSFIARMDSDDFSYPERLEKQLQYFLANPSIDVLGTSCREFGSAYALAEKHLPTQHEDLLNFSVTRCPFIHPTVMFRASVFKKGYRYPMDTTLTEDMALWFELLNAGFNFANINEILLDYRLSESTIDRRRGLSKATSEIKVRMKNMISLQRVTAKNIMLILCRIAFHLMPTIFVRLAYKKIR